MGYLAWAVENRVFTTRIAAKQSALRIRIPVGPRMKNFFTGFLIVNLLVEAVAALTLIGAPGTMFAASQVDAITWARTYGFAALAIGSTLFWVWPYRGDIKVTGAVLGLLLTFHTSISVSMSLPGGQTGPVVLHGILAALCAVLFTQRSKWCVQ